MNKYYVVSSKDYDEWVELKTDDKEEAIHRAREEATRKGYKVEIRTYVEDIEDENCTCFDYDTVDYSVDKDGNEVV